MAPTERHEYMSITLKEAIQFAGAEAAGGTTINVVPSPALPVAPALPAMP
jgi:hypothetical protein